MKNGIKHEAKPTRDPEIALPTYSAEHKLLLL